MIDIKTGKIILTNGGRLIGPNSLKPEIRNLFPTSETVIENQEFEQIYIGLYELYPNYTFGLYLQFFKNTLFDITLSAYPKTYSSWEDWTEAQQERETKANDQFLLDTLGQPPYVYSWGRIVSCYDQRSGNSFIIISYQAKIDYWNEVNSKRRRR